ncbi:MAG TPA: hypothetical protein VLY20_06290 [Nitrospiria bacterium]|nr:hypothetical protein [Nitrospiria bacterium]
MKRIMNLIAMMVITLSLTAVSMADEGHQMGGKGVKGMSKEDLIKLALSAAPPEIARDASVMLPGEDGKMIEAKHGTNGFTCLPDIHGQSIPDPICSDQAAAQWINDMMSGAPRPTNTVPGISYMARGGWHYEKDGKVTMKEGEAGSKLVSEPPHWMVFWSFDSKTSGIPAGPNKFGTWIMFEGTPYAHLMVYQNPVWIK